MSSTRVLRFFCWCSIAMLLEEIHCEWVEIPQFSNKKSYLGVTPYSPYIYEQSLFTSTTPSSFDTNFQADLYPIHGPDGDKASITKMPDIVMKLALSTEIPALKKSTLKPPNIKNGTTKTERNKNRRKDHNKIQHMVNGNKTSSTTSTTTTTQSPKVMVNKVLSDEYEYEEMVYDDDEEYEEDRYREETDGVGVDDEYYDDNEYEEDEMETEKGDNAGYTYAGFMPYLQNIQSTLIKNSHTNLKSKVTFLSEIKDRLLYAIQDKISSLWSSKPKQRFARSAREDMSWEKSGHGMDFPSNEGALLTLGFLTFAVFLIKCILKLIHAVKGKTNKGQVVVIQYSTTTTTAAPMMMGMGKRSISDQEAIEMMDLIDKYKFQ